MSKLVCKLETLEPRFNKNKLTNVQIQEKTGSFQSLQILVRNGRTIISMRHKGKV